MACEDVSSWRVPRCPRGGPAILAINPGAASDQPGTDRQDACQRRQRWSAGREGRSTVRVDVFLVDHSVRELFERVKELDGLHHSGQLIIHCGSAVNASVNEGGSEGCNGCSPHSVRAQVR